jgi:5-carboxymethyl-2-hydroxymuconate isomerase
MASLAVEYGPALYSFVRSAVLLRHVKEALEASIFGIAGTRVTGYSLPQK